MRDMFGQQQQGVLLTKQLLDDWHLRYACAGEVVEC
jgi:hypothetical protein